MIPIRRALAPCPSLLVATAILVTGAPAHSAELAFPRYAQKEGRLDGEGLPLSGVELCLLPGRTQCFAMPSSPLPNSKTERYEFGLQPRSERLPIGAGGSWVFFSGMFSGGGSGMLERVAVLRYGADGRIENLMPEVTETEVADRAMWNLPDVSPYPVFVRADYLWGDGETHFEAHRFRVDAWIFDPATQRYRRAMTYDTTRRYDRGDGDDKVLKVERDEILRRLAAAH